jgi:hypothetical protein
LIFDLWDVDENTSDETKRILNAQISEATGVKFGNYIQSVDDALTLVPHEWNWEPLWQKLLQQLRDPNPDHPDKMMAPGTSPEILYPLPIAITLTALVIHRMMSLERGMGRL